MTDDTEIPETPQPSQSSSNDTLSTQEIYEKFTLPLKLREAERAEQQPESCPGELHSFIYQDIEREKDLHYLTQFGAPVLRQCLFHLRGVLKDLLARNEKLYRDTFTWGPPVPPPDYAVIRWGEETVAPHLDDWKKFDKKLMVGYQHGDVFKIDFDGLGAEELRAWLVDAADARKDLLKCNKKLEEEIERLRPEDSQGISLSFLEHSV